MMKISRFCTAKKIKNKKKEDNSIEKELKVLKENLEQSLKDYSELCDRKKLHEYAHELLRDSGIKTKIIRQYVPIINKYVNKFIVFRIYSP